LKIQKAHIVGYSLGGVIAMNFVSDHPDRSLSLTLGGMGWLKEGSGLQAVWERMGNRPTSRPGAGRLAERFREATAAPPAAMHGAAKLALTEDQVKAIKTPTKVLVGDHDPCRQMYVDPLIAVRKDISVVTIEDAGHLNCIMKPQFKDELVKWIDANTKR
jgi:pimeloyl-ACP methyl ester carboxylesterase